MGRLEACDTAGWKPALRIRRATNIQGDSFALSIVALMNANIADGTSSSVLTSSPNADETNALRLTLAMFYKLATPANGSVADEHDRSPRQHRASAGAQRRRDLPAIEDSRSLSPRARGAAVCVDDRGEGERLGQRRFHVRRSWQSCVRPAGRAWIANNVIQGSAASISPFTGGGLLGPGFGVDVDRAGNPWFGNFGWGNDFPNGCAAAVAAAQWLRQRRVSRAGHARRSERQRVARKLGNGKVVVFPGGDGNATPIVYPPGDEAIANFAPFGIAIAADGTAWVTSSASPSTITHLQLSVTDSTLTLIGDVITIGNTLKGIVIDSAGNIWTGSGGDDHVYAFKSDGTLIGGYQGGGIVGPRGITLDGADNVWVANFGPLEPGSVHPGCVTQLAGMGLKVDAAGNVWTCNNWKPSFDMDVFGDPFNGIAANPGGDGMVIFIGVATPVTY
jgi:hypothetical protein